MELLTGDGRIASPSNFPQQISPFPAAGNLLVSVSNPTAVTHSAHDVNINLPPQKLRPIRGAGRFPLNSGADYLAPPPAGTLEQLGLFGVHGEASEYFESPDKTEAGDVAINGGGVSGAQCAVVDGSVKVESGTDEGNGDPNWEGRLFEDGSSSSSDDDNDSLVGIQKSQSRKRKRKTRKKLEEFLESLVTKVMDKQEQMHKQLIEMIERKERERVMREEAWKQQEIERMKRDEEVRAQETSRNLALISFIQNILGHGLEIPQVLSTILHVENNGAKDGGNIPIQNDVKCDPNNRRWPEAEVQALIMLRTALEQKFQMTGSKTSSIWHAISAGMYNMGYNRTAKKCKEKWENINKYFKKSFGSGVKERNENSKACPYFHELDVLYKNGFVNPGDASNPTSNENEVSSGSR